MPGAPRRGGSGTCSNCQGSRPGAAVACQPRTVRPATWATASASARCSSERAPAWSLKRFRAPMQLGPTSRGNPKAACIPAASAPCRNSGQRSVGGEVGDQHRRARVEGIDARPFPQDVLHVLDRLDHGVGHADVAQGPLLREQHDAGTANADDIRRRRAQRSSEDRAHRRRAPRPLGRYEPDRSHRPSSPSSSLGKRQTRVQATTGTGSRPHANDSAERIRPPDGRTVLPAIGCG